MPGNRNNRIVLSITWVMQMKDWTFVQGSVKARKQKQSYWTIYYMSNANDGYMLGWAFVQGSVNARKQKQSYWTIYSMSNATDGYMLDWAFVQGSENAYKFVIMFQLTLCSTIQKYHEPHVNQTVCSRYVYTVIHYMKCFPARQWNIQTIYQSCVLA